MPLCLAPRLYVTWDIISETATLLRYRRSYREALTFLTEIKPNLHIINYGEVFVPKRNKYSAATARDRKLSFCDAVSFVVVTALLNDMPSLAFDADFRDPGSSSSLRLFQDRPNPGLFARWKAPKSGSNSSKRSTAWLRSSC